MEKGKGTAQRPTASRWSLPAHIIIGGALGALVTLGTLFLYAMLLSRDVAGEGSTGWVLPLCALLGGLISGGFAVKGASARRLPVGFAAGAVMSLLLLAAGVLLYGEEVTWHTGVWLWGACSGGGILSAVPGRQKKKRRR